MAPALRIRRSALAILALVVAISIGGGVIHLGNPIDVANRALESHDSPEARDLAELRARFGDDRSVLLGYAVANGLRLEAGERAAVAGIAAELRDLDGIVRGVRILDGVAPALTCLAVDLNEGASQDGADRVVELARARCPTTLSIHVTAPQLAERAVANALAGERASIVPAVAGLLVVLLWCVWRRLVVALLVLLPAVAAITVTGALFALAGHRLDPVVTLLDPVLLTVGVAVGVHVVESFTRHRDPATVRRNLATPITWTATTTVVGFAAVAWTELPAVVAFGTYAAFGVAFVSALSLWAVPVWLAACPDGWRPRPADWTRLPAQVSRIAIRHRVATLWIAGGVTVLAIAGLTRTHVDNDPIALLDADTPFRRDFDWLVGELGGVETATLRIPAESAARDPEWATLLGADLIDRPGVLGPARPPRVSAAGDLAFTAVLAPAGSAERLALFDGVDAHAAALGFPEVRIAGDTVQTARDSMRLVHGQMRGWLALVPLIALVVGVGLRSWRLGLLALLPNVAPPLIVYGTMGWLGRPLSVATVMIGCAMMGLVVDDTIHLLHAAASARRAGHGRRVAVARALVHTGRAISMTTLVLGAGLAVGVFGSLTTTVEFALLSSATIVLAWAFDLLVLPALLTVDATGPSAEKGAPRTVPTLETPCLTTSTC